MRHPHEDNLSRRPRYFERWKGINVDVGDEGRSVGRVFEGCGGWGLILGLLYLILEKH
jgi:hypothetical protein